MIDERAFIAQVEAADVQKLAQLLRHPSKEEETVLRTYLGDERYRRMHSLALQGIRRSAAGMPRGNIVVLHGIMGGELTRYPVGKAGIHFWMSIPRIVLGEFANCRMDDDGRGEAFDIRPSGILKRYYGELMLYLASQNWNVRPFWFDWRKDIQLSASSLETKLREWFPDNDPTPVHLIAHSMGGLVARAFMRAYPERWSKLAERGSKLIMLGTPNFGSYAITQVLSGTESTVRLIARFDLRNSLQDIRAIAGTFLGCYQMLPAPESMQSASVLYEPETWGQLPGVSQRHLQSAREFQQWLNAEIDPDPIYIAGCNKPTADGIRDMELFRAPGIERQANKDLYHFTSDGDGTVPHRLGFIKDGKQVFNRIYFVEEEHGRLPQNRQVMEAIRDLLDKNNGETKVLSATAPAKRGRNDERKLAEEWHGTREWFQPTESQDRSIREPDSSARELDDSARRAKQFSTLVAQVTNRFRNLAIPMERRNVEMEQNNSATVASLTDAKWDQLPVSGDERKLESAALRSFLYADDDVGRKRFCRSEIGDPPAIEIGAACGSLQSTDFYNDLGGPPVDCIAVGHYMGVRPQNAELYLDQAISRAVPKAATRLSTEFLATPLPLTELPSAEPAVALGDPPEVVDPGSLQGQPQEDILSERDLIITQFTDRGTLMGQLGQPFLLPDPRDPSGQRVVAIAGMGLPGRFGVPELTVLARELCWALGRLGKRHLVTVLIGGGSGNLATNDAVQAWLRGIAQALGGAYEKDAKRLHRVTFVEHDPKRAVALREAIEEAAEHIKQLLKVEPVTFIKGEEEYVKPEKRSLDLERVPRPRQQASQSTDMIPTRVTVQMIGDAYHFGAITESASIPERVIKIDPRIVMRANDKLAASSDYVEQQEQGRFLERLLIPRDLRQELASQAPLVVVLDRTTARLHWEVAAQPDPLSDMETSVNGQTFDPDRFLGTARGLTRQFRTVLAPPPEPPPPPNRVLRVLVVANPAADAPLPGAELEGIEVADLFESFNTLFANRTKNRIEVERLFGPYEATRENVLQRLMLESWDVLHFAGHCYFNAQEPSASGWIFAAKDLEVLSANELNRIDRVACAFALCYGAVFDLLPHVQPAR